MKVAIIPYLLHLNFSMGNLGRIFTWGPLTILFLKLFVSSSFDSRLKANLIVFWRLNSFRILYRMVFFFLPSWNIFLFIGGQGCKGLQQFLVCLVCLRFQILCFRFFLSFRHYFCCDLKKVRLKFEILSVWKRWDFYPFQTTF